MIQRYIAKFKALRNRAARLNRTTQVEQQMWNAYFGKRPMPDKDQLKEWALKIGIPDEYRSFK